MATKNVIWQQKTASGYDELLPKPSPHASTHASDGSDPIPNGAISGAMLASGSVTTAVSVTIPAMQANTATTVNVSEVTTSNHIIVTPAPASFVAYTEAQVRCTAQGSGTLTFIASEATSQLVANVLIINK